MKRRGGGGSGRRAKKGKGRVGGCWYGVWVLGIYGFLVLLSPVGGAVQLGADEHFALVKAEVVRGGAVPNRDFYSDQPPVLAYMLAGLFEVFGSSVLVGRLMVAGLTGWMLWVLMRLWGEEWLKGLLFALLLLGAPKYFFHTVSVMADPVKIPLCVVSYGLGMLAVRGGRVWLGVLGGFVMGWAVLVKLTAVLYLPGLLLGLWLGLRGIEGRGRWGVLVGFVGGGLVWLPYLVWLLWHWSGQLWGSHFSAVGAVEVSPEAYVFGWRHVLMGLPWWLGGLACVGLVMWGKVGLGRVSFPLVGLVVHLLVALVHRPWWDYYLLDLWLMLAWLSAEGLGWVWGRMGVWRRGVGRLAMVRVGFGMLGLVGLPTAAVLGVWANWEAFGKVERIGDSAVVSYLRMHPPGEGEVMFSNRPIVVFHGGWRLPPGLAVLSWKRFWSGSLDEAGVVSALDAAGVRHIYFAGAMEDVDVGQLRYAEREMGHVQRLGDGVLFSR